MENNFPLVGTNSVSRQYGGEMAIRLNRKIVNFDPYYGYHLTQIHTAWMEKMFVDDWTLAPEKYDYTKNLRPNQCQRTFSRNLGIYRPLYVCCPFASRYTWQDIPPADGREFIADDVPFIFTGCFGLGSGYTQPSPSQAANPSFKQLLSVIPADKYTVVFK